MKKNRLLLLIASIPITYCNAQTNTYEITATNSATKQPSLINFLRDDKEFPEHENPSIWFYKNLHANSDFNLRLQ